MRGKAALSAFSRVFLAAIGYFCKTYETLTMGWEGGRTHRTYSRRGMNPA
ncbi:hypothetical protein HMPREF0742_01447 [Rothia aeria F0184]|uniref:Uncharacterized protein n=1 Tax=Rothia aeria F0184 TaxID=888019 RepID=U7V2Z2_9MICC|nr:hypothetical protein HMPREF0742_01447 [Rothia aeria F0184]